MFRRNLLPFLISLSFLWGELYNHFNGQITYFGYHVLHDWKGVSSNINGFMREYSALLPEKKSIFFTLYNSF